MVSFYLASPPFSNQVGENSELSRLPRFRNSEAILSKKWDFLYIELSSLRSQLEYWNDGILEYWNVGLNREVTHLLMRLRRINPLSRGISPILHLLEPIIPSLQYSNIPIVSEAN